MTKYTFGKFEGMTDGFAMVRAIAENEFAAGAEVFAMYGEGHAVSEVAYATVLDACERVAEKCNTERAEVFTVVKDYYWAFVAPEPQPSF